MAPSNPMPYTTSYDYKSLQSSRHIRLLEVEYNEHDISESGSPRYSLVHHALPADGTPIDFEAVSYTWGDPEQVSGLQFFNETGHIGLTANLTDALPHISRESNTRRLWIDQLCINQADMAEKAIQLGLMSEIYKQASRVIVWLGPEDNSSLVCKDWLRAISELIPTVENKERLTPGNPKYHPDVRSYFLKNTFSDPLTDPVFAPAIHQFWTRPWFRRGWICQEFLLAREVICLMGSVKLSFQDLVDLFSIPLGRATGWESHVFLMWLKLYPFTDAAPLRYLRLMQVIASEFQTKEVSDRLFGVLGLMAGLDFTPDYTLSVRQNFTRFAVTIARDFGSLDFLSLWSANLDPLVPKTPPELLGFPSWVPAWTATPLSAPWRLVSGGANSYRSEILWNAAAGRRHVHDQIEDASTTSRLHVRGKVIDYVETISSARFTKYWDFDDEYKNELANQIREDLPNCENWSYTDLIRYLNVVLANGGAPQQTAEQWLGLAPQEGSEKLKAETRANHLGCCLAMGRGRRFARTEAGRLCLVPAIGSRARTDENRGSAIVVVHGCIVPVVLEAVGDGEAEWRLLGDCYVEGAMLGEAVEWQVEDAQTFILV